MQMAELCKNIRELKSILYGNSDSEPVAEACAQLTQEFFRENTLRLLIVCLPKLNLEVILLVTMFDFVVGTEIVFFHGSSVIIFNFFYTVLHINHLTEHSVCQLVAEICCVFAGPKRCYSSCRKFAKATSSFAVNCF